MYHQITTNYTYQGFVHAINIYNYPEDYPNLDIIPKAMRYLLQYQKVPRGGLPRLTEIMQDVFNKALANQNRPLAREIADVMDTHCRQMGNVLLEQLRELDDEEYEEGEGKNDRVVYNDSQNVHNTEINKSVLRAAKYLYSLYQHKIPKRTSHVAPNRDICYTSIKKRLSKITSTSLVENSIKYIKKNIATFGQDITLEDTFLSLWLWIYKHKYREELEKRLVEELRATQGFCTTGHLARLINVVQGFTDDENLQIKISLKDQAKSVVRTFLSRQLQECKDAFVIEGMLDRNYQYQKFLKRVMLRQKSIWSEEYGKEFIRHAKRVAIDFAGVNFFRINTDDIERVKCHYPLLI